MGIFDGINASASGLTAQRLRMDTISENIANANTSGYKRKIVEIAPEGSAPFSQYLSDASKGLISSRGNGVKVTSIVEDQSPPKKVYDPTNPNADKDGYVSMPNIDIVTEMVNMMSAERSYEANVTAMDASKSMAMKALEIGK